MKSSRERSIKQAAAIPAPPPRKLFLVVLILIPILFFVLLEAGLRIFDYGYDYTQWVNPIKGKFVLNPDIAHRYFHGIESVPYSNGDIFDEVKQPNTFRIFVLGESSGAGYPFLPTGSFSRYLQRRLSLVYPESKIEVINCSMTAINSYAMRDLFPGILREKPDLVLVYAGHNEYYGALGAGSVESLGNSRRLVNFAIGLESLRTFQLIRDLIGKFGTLISGKKQRPSGTLMARMAQNQYIEFDSEVYKRGVEQFEGNMRDILGMASTERVPVILGTLACNLKDQKPFVSVSDGRFPRADQVFAGAKQALVRNDWKSADSLFRYAKDLDALRFRAPTEINTAITALATEFHYPLVNIDSAFDALSPSHIAGDNLMTDHLHPTLRGYQLIGGLFYREMELAGKLPASTPQPFNDRQQDSITAANFPFTGLDSVIASYRIKLLKNDWPYVSKKDKIPDAVLLAPRNHIDSIALELVGDRTNWDLAHRKTADWYASRRDVISFTRTMETLINQYPIVTDYYDYTVTTLMRRRTIPD